MNVKYVVLKNFTMPTYETSNSTKFVNFKEGDVIFSDDIDLQYIYFGDARILKSDVGCLVKRLKWNQSEYN